MSFKKEEQEERQKEEGQSCQEEPRNWVSIVVFVVSSSTDSGCPEEQLDKLPIKKWLI